MPLDNSPLWFKNAIIYEVPVRAFADSNGDGIGDFRGLTEKLDYLQELGVTALWVLPFFPSPLRDDGYDISDYLSVNPIYGTLDDFKEFLAAAHARDIRVIIELIVNHTSDQHPWFKRAQLAPAGSSERDFYVWSDSTDKYKGTRIIFQDFETSNWTWDPVAKAYYWHRFYAHQPDINYDNPAVQQAVLEVLDFWLELGVDGLRMDAVPYLYEREGTSCENLKETHDFLKKMRQYVDDRYHGRMLLAEANQWPEDAAAYYGDGDECHMNFHFPLMPRLFMSLRMEDNFPIIDILQQTPEIPENCQWGLFLRNHDELTLEMVTDEDRDYMYRVYAQDQEMRINLGIRRRLVPLLENDRRQIELLNGLLLSLPGTPVLYYGDEIGMGDNVYLGDRNGVRTPMQWSPDRNAGFSPANPHKLYLPLIVDSEYHYTTLNVEAQRSAPNSLLNWTKRLIATRKRYQAFGWGDFHLTSVSNRKVLAFTRTYDNEEILVVANLSRFVQSVQLDLSLFKGRVPMEIFGRNDFPAIGDEGSYFLSLGPYAFYWFALKPSAVVPLSPSEIPSITLQQWETIFAPAQRGALEDVLDAYLARRQWLGVQLEKVRSTALTECMAIPDSDTYMLCLRVEYRQGDPKTYLLFVSYAFGESAAHLLNESSSMVLARLQLSGAEEDEVGVLYDAIADKDFLKTLLETTIYSGTFEGINGKLVATSLIPAAEANMPSDSRPLKGQFTNNSVIYADDELRSHTSLILKLFRTVDAGINPDLEIRQFLKKHQQFNNFNVIVGYLDYRRTDADAATIGVLQTYIPEAQNTWEYTLDNIRNYFEQVVVESAEMTEEPPILQPVMALQAEFDQDSETKRVAAHLMGTYLPNMKLLGQRTAEFHIALCADPTDSAFAPEPFSTFYQRSIYQYNRNQTGQVFRRIKDDLNSPSGHLNADLQPLARTLLSYQDIYLERFHQILDCEITAMRTRYHGDYHLGQVLYTGKDFVLIDFEGEDNRTVSERRIKRSPLQDVAYMLQSIHYAVINGFQNEVDSGLIRLEQSDHIQQWAQFWEQWVSAAFLSAYLDTARAANFLPKTQQELQILLDNYLLSKAIHDVGYKLAHRSPEIDVPMRRLLQFVDEQLT
ncbi:MAG: maltose alpha-D-glucosyltransferase [Phormidesmis sp. RL_2_1]|nr:maltose alpha-D-glucosyltransferase [Phormidesmis sp. RL_2_1]